MEGESYARIDGNLICPSCGKEYYKHPREIWYNGVDSQELSLIRSCDGNLLKP